MNQNSDMGIKQFDIKKFLDLVMKENLKSLKNIFSSEIKPNFLIEVFYLVIRRFSDPIDLFSLFDITYNNDRLITGDFENIEYEICRNIVYLHKEDCIFISDKERRNKENSGEYKNKLVTDVINNLRLRRYAAIFFRKKQITLGDEFLFFRVPYQLFVITTYATSLIPVESKFSSFYTNILNKSLSSLVLMESNFLDNCYPLCRGIIELLIKLSVLKINENAIDLYNSFVDVEIIKNCCNQEYSDDFITKWNNRINKHCKNKIDYLHFGWVDQIDGYHDISGGTPYSLDGLFTYLGKYLKDDTEISILKRFYKMCHIYTHGSIGYSKYPLLHYFEISIILYFTIVRTYMLLCEECKINTFIDGFDIISSIKENFNALFEQYSKKTTDNFNAYYKQK